MIDLLLTSHFYYGVLPEKVASVWDEAKDLRERRVEGLDP